MPEDDEITERHTKILKSSCFDDGFDLKLRWVTLASVPNELQNPFGLMNCQFFLTQLCIVLLKFLVLTLLNKQPSLLQNFVSDDCQQLQPAPLSPITINNVLMSRLYRNLLAFSKSDNSFYP